MLHPQYRNSQADFDLDAPPRLDNDVALIILDEPVDGVPLQRLAGPNATVRARTCDTEAWRLHESAHIRLAACPACWVLWVLRAQLPP